MNKLITMAELQCKSAPELLAMFNSASAQLVTTERFSRDRQNVLASIENISRALDCIWWRVGGL